MPFNMYMYLISDAVKTMHSNKYMYRNYRVTEKCEKPKLWNIYSTQQYRLIYFYTYIVSDY